KACIDQLVKLYTKWSTLKKIPLKRRSSIASLAQIEKFQAELNKLSDFSPPDVENILSHSRRRSSSWEEDLKFLNGQRQYPQIGYMIGVDKTLAEKEKKRAERQKTAQLAESKRAQIQRITQEEDIDISDSSSSNDDDVLVEKEFTLSRLRKRKRPSTISLAVPAKTLVKAISQVSVSRGLSVRDPTVVVASVVKAAGGDINDLTLSTSSTWRSN
ncbi:Cc8K15.2-like protein, partial [Daphnia magna]